MDGAQFDMPKGKVWEPLARAIAAIGTDQHVDRLIDLIGAGVPHDLVTVTRYSATQTPEFVKHRRFSDEMVRRYLASYYVYDPFYAQWRRERRLGIVPLKRLADDEVKRGQYIAEFLAQSAICDEVGILLKDGGDWCLGIFLDRSRRSFKDSEIAALEERFPVFAALHATDIKTRAPDFSRSSVPASPGASPRPEPRIPVSLWPELSGRERELVQLVLAGHPTAAISKRLGITIGTVKNHRRRIYEKLDITTERELFLQFFQHSADPGERG
jgi:DNA-binding CsgD family transcriptional regulator